MKLKILITILDIVLIIFFVSIFILPIAMSTINAKSLIQSYWFLILAFLALFAFVNIIYLKNKNIIESIETGDWTALCVNLEREVFDKTNLSFKNIKLLSEVQLLLSDFKGLKRLEVFVRANKGEYLSKLATNFAGGKFLSGEFCELYDFTTNLIKSGNKDEWLIFYKPFALQMQKSYIEASNNFKELLDSFSEPILNLMTAYFYYKVLENYCKLSFKGRQEKVQAFKNTFKKTFTSVTWKTYTAKKKESIHILVFKKIIDDASNWVFQI